MTVRIKADERIGRTVGEPYIDLYLERTALLDRSLSTVEEREVDRIRIQIGGTAGATYHMAPRHLNDLIALLERTRDRLNDIDDEVEDDDS